jgi:thymidylate synthase
VNKLDEQYRGLLAEVLHNGVEKEDRTGTGTLSRFGMSIRHDMSKGFPLLTTKKMAWKTMVTELKWFLRGDTNIKYLLDNNCNIWNGDAYRNFLKHSIPHDHQETLEEFIEKIKTNDKFAKKWGELGPIYGYQWRKHSRYGVRYDQLKQLIEDIKQNPNSRRLLVDSWNVELLDQMTLPPCHYSFQCYVADGKLSLMWNQRSADLFLGVPFNISSYGLLLHLLCKETNLEPGYLIGSFGDIHLYKNHIEQAKEQISRDGFDLPELELEYYDIYTGDFEASLKNYQSHPAIKAPLSN